MDSGGRILSFVCSTFEVTFLSARGTRSTQTREIGAHQFLCGYPFSAWGPCQKEFQLPGLPNRLNRVYPTLNKSGRTPKRTPSLGLDTGADSPDAEGDLEISLSNLNRTGVEKQNDMNDVEVEQDASMDDAFLKLKASADRSRVSKSAAAHRSSRTARQVEKSLKLPKYQHATSGRHSAVDKIFKYIEQNPVTGRPKELLRDTKNADVRSAETIRHDSVGKSLASAHREDSHLDSSSCLQDYPQLDNDEESYTDEEPEDEIDGASFLQYLKEKRSFDLDQYLRKLKNRETKLQGRKGKLREGLTKGRRKMNDLTDTKSRLSTDETHKDEGASTFLTTDGNSVSMASEKASRDSRAGFNLDGSELSSSVRNGLAGEEYSDSLSDSFQQEPDEDPEMDDSYDGQNKNTGSACTIGREAYSRLFSFARSGGMQPPLQVSPRSTSIRASPGKKSGRMGEGASSARRVMRSSLEVRRPYPHSERATQETTRGSRPLSVHQIRELMSDPRPLFPSTSRRVTGECTKCEGTGLGECKGCRGEIWLGSDDIGWAQCNTCNGIGKGLCEECGGSGKMGVWGFDRSEWKKVFSLPGLIDEDDIDEKDCKEMSDILGNEHEEISETREGDPDDNVWNLLAARTSWNENLTLDQDEDIEDDEDEEADADAQDVLERVDLDESNVRDVANLEYGIERGIEDDIDFEQEAEDEVMDGNSSIDLGDEEDEEEDEEDFEEHGSDEFNSDIVGGLDMESGIDDDGDDEYEVREIEIEDVELEEGRS